MFNPDPVPEPGGASRDSRGMKVIDLRGRIFGSLTVVQRSRNHYSQPHWLCVCECGNAVDVRGGNLRSGNTRSCGCLPRGRLAQ